MVRKKKKKDIEAHIMSTGRETVNWENWRHLLSNNNINSNEKLLGKSKL